METVMKKIALGCQNKGTESSRKNNRARRTVLKQVKWECGMLSAELLMAQKLRGMRRIRKRLIRNSSSQGGVKLSRSQIVSSFIYTKREIGYTQKMEIIRMSWFWEKRSHAVWRSRDFGWTLWPPHATGLAGLICAKLCDENFAA